MKKNRRRNSGNMERLKLLGLILLVIGLALGVIWLYEEFFNNFNYYYNHQVNFVLLVLVGVFSLVIGLRFMFWEREPKKQNPS